MHRQNEILKCSQKMLNYKKVQVHAKFFRSDFNVLMPVFSVISLMNKLVLPFPKNELELQHCVIAEGIQTSKFIIKSF